MRGERFVFVGGAHRSGTTLLQNMLDSHPAILGGPEFLHLSEIIRLRQRLRRSIDEGLIQAFCSHEDVDDAIATLIERLLLPVADDHGSAILSEKSPNNVRVFEELLYIFPGARAIQTVRDPRAVVASLINVRERAIEMGKPPPGRSASLRRAIGATKAAMNAGVEASTNMSERLLTIKYEDLVSDPVDVTRRVCEFLEIEWSPRMTKPSEFDHLGERPITESGLWYQPETFSRDPEPENIDKWIGQLTALQAAIIERSLGSVASEFGYRFKEKRPIHHRLLSRFVDWIHRRMSELSESGGFRNLRKIIGA